MRRVVVTGCGWATPCGNDLDQVFSDLLAGLSGIDHIVGIPEDMLPQLRSQIAGQVDIGDFAVDRRFRHYDDFIKYGLFAAEKAWQQSGLNPEHLNKQRCGVLAGSGIGGIESIERSANTCMTKGPKKMSPHFIPSSIVNMLAGAISIQYDFQGPNLNISTACTTGSHNIGMAAHLIQSGLADCMIAGGAEKASCTLSMGGFSAMRALSTRNDAPQQASRPFDKDRDGFVLSDGAAMLVLESEEHARQRGATILAEIDGFGMSSDASHPVAPNGEGAFLAMQHALESSQCDLEDITYINAHGTSTPLGDAIELDAIQRLFGDHAANLCISSTKSQLGHTIAAAGAIEAIICILTINKGMIPPTINLDNPDNVHGLNLVPHQMITRDVEVAMSNSFGFGSTNGCLIFKRYHAS